VNPLGTERLAGDVPLVGGIEAGGTKFVCAVGRGPGDVQTETRFATTSPEETIGRAIAFFQEQERPVAAVGIGSFGPIDPRPDSPTFGYVTATPKPGWNQVDFAGAVRRAVGVPVAFDTDVNAAALAEHRWGAARGLSDFIYLTVGTGIGGGAMVNGRLLHGLLHPEMGHILLPRDPKRDPFPGRCPFHGDCLEGLAAGPALAARWGQAPETLPADHPAWPLQAHYLGLALAGFVCILSPRRIILGGGVMAQPRLFELVRAEVQQLLNGYVQAPEIVDEIEKYIVPPALGGQAGVLGAIALARQVMGY
jgi:fructokinase